MAIDTSLTFELRDEYNRKPIAEKIIRLLSSDVDVSPLVIDGGWGTGKTEFCQKLINLLDDKNKLEVDRTDELENMLGDEITNLRAIYVDAFKADHADEPLMTLLAAILKLLPENEKKSLKEKALPAIRFGAKTALKASVSWLLKQEVTDLADDYESDIKKAGDEIVNSSIESLLDDHVKSDESIETLKVALKELTKDKPIAIFVDELDRCRPDFAISMLESIKHVFDVDGVQFVLVVNTEQLKASVNHCYGEEVKAQQYLDKFIGYKFPIPNIIDRNGHRSKLASVEHFLNIINARQIEVTEEVESFSKELISINKISLREVEKFVKYIEIYKVFTNSHGLSRKSYGNNILSIFGVYLSCFRPGLISHIDIDLLPILEILGSRNHLPSPKTSSNYRYANIVAAAIILDDEVLIEDESEETKEYWNKIVHQCFSDGFGREFEKMPDIVGVADILCLK